MITFSVGDQVMKGRTTCGSSCWVKPVLVIGGNYYHAATAAGKRGVGVGIASNDDFGEHANGVIRVTLR